MKKISAGLMAASITVLSIGYLVTLPKAQSFVSKDQIENPGSDDDFLLAAGVPMA